MITDFDLVTFVNVVYLCSERPDIILAHNICRNMSIRH